MSRSTPFSGFRKGRLPPAALLSVWPAVNAAWLYGRHSADLRSSEDGGGGKRRTWELELSLLMDHYQSALSTGRSASRKTSAIYTKL
jgi:hypothetical protein